MDLPKQYDPAAAQSKWYAIWERHGYFNADPPAEGESSPKPPHTIMMPLPNVTGALHMGHALNGTLQDLITRWRRMQGFEALWMPGTDHAGIATQSVVERRMLEEEGLTRHDVGREALVNRIWKWKEVYEGRILGQLRQIGASCDWRRKRFTLDEVCSKAVRRTFFKLFQDGLVFRGKRLVNWDTFLQTAVADDEVFHEEVDGHFWTFSYPVVDENGNATGETIAFSTTRPETMLGDTAVCVHPSDERYAHLVGKKVRLPLVGRDVPIIADGLLAKPEMGTGVVKVTPAHDPNDYACGQRNGLEMINIMNPDGTLNEHAGRFAGMKMLEARPMVADAMESLGLFVSVEERKIELGHSDRSKTPIEPYLSDQWFVRMGQHKNAAGQEFDLAQSAIDAVESNRVSFFPSRYARTYLDWLGEKRDWCISRQLWWGHRIPVWSITDNTTWQLESGGTQSEWLQRRQAEATTKLKEYLNAAGVDRSEFEIQLPDRPGHIVIRCCGESRSAESALTALKEFQEANRAVHGLGTPDPISMPHVPGYASASDPGRELVIRGGFKIEQDPDVLDTWFSSALWPHETLGWPDLDHDPPMDEAEIAKQVEAVGLGTHRGADAPRSPSPTNGVLDYFYPGDVLVTSRDIITLWVARMVLAGLYNMGDVPFKHVCIHPKILDGFGQTMSKSKGNGVDPMDLIDKYGADAVRFTIASLAGETQDVRLPVGYECPHCETVIPQTLEHQRAIPGGGANPTIRCPKCKQEAQYSSPWFQPDADAPVARIVSERFEYGRNFCNKLWNAARFALLNLEGYTPATVDEVALPIEDRWILSRLSATAHELTELLGRYQFDAATRTIREFTWNEFCDWYLEMLKPRLRDEEAKPVAQRVLVSVLDALVRMLQPFTPFLAEELWQRLAEIAPVRGVPEPTVAAESAMIAPWVMDAPGKEGRETASGSRAHLVADDWRDAALEARFARLQETIVAVRNVRAVYSIPPGTPLSLHVRCAPEVARDFDEVADQFDNLAKTTLAAAGGHVERPPGSAGFTLEDAEGFIPLEGIIDRAAELARQRKEADKLRGFIAGSEKKLSNESFVGKAPPEVVAQVRETLEGQRKQLESVERIIADLSGT
ncbi:MAG: valine--tRNA ligase [Planctomycetales bacterium]